MKKILLFCLLLSSISSLDCKINIGWRDAVRMDLSDRCDEIVKVGNDSNVSEQKIISLLKKYITNHKDVLDIVVSTLEKQMKLGRFSNVLYEKTKKELKNRTILSEKEVMKRCNDIYRLIFSDRDFVREFVFVHRLFEDRFSTNMHFIDLRQKTKKEKEEMVARRIISLLQDLARPEPWMSETIGLKSLVFILIKQMKCGHLKYSFTSLIKVLFGRKIKERGKLLES